jgi:hypothetical protein
MAVQPQVGQQPEVMPFMQWAMLVSGIQEMRTHATWSFAWSLFWKVGLLQVIIFIALALLFG